MDASKAPTDESVKQIDETNISKEQRSSTRSFSFLAGESRGGNAKYPRNDEFAGVSGPLIERPVERYVISSA